MTVQTAIRAIGEKYKKYDDEDSDENSSAEMQKKYSVIADLIHNAKGIIADEVHHWAAETCQIISDHSYNARFKYGMSATPVRDMGDDLLIDACFGKIISEINASFLIKQGILVKPTIYFVHTKKRMNDEVTYQTAYKESIVQNDERNLMIANVSQNMVKEGRHVLILVKHVEHGEILEKMIPNSVFLSGSNTSKARQKHIDQMRNKEKAITIATSIFDEGVDVKPLDGLILAGSGKSQTRALQRIGRVIRCFQDPVTGKEKKDAYIVDFHDHMKYMLNHSKARRRIYETEPEFVIKDFKGS
jgi:superfamily II DNA or RNA helicase